MTSAQERNERLGITGLLLYRNGRFIQIIEGPKNAVENVYSSIASDHRHKVQMFTKSTIYSRAFAQWSLGFRPLSDDNSKVLATYGKEYYPHAPDADAPGGPIRSQAIFDQMYHLWLTPTSPPAQRPGALDTNSYADELEKPKIPPSHGRLGETSVGTAPQPPFQVPPKSSAAGKTDESYSTAASSAVSSVYDFLLSEVDTGALLPGDRINDRELAVALGTSRTPVREALQQLRTLGMIEVSTSRSTRISVIDSHQTAQSIAVLAWLYQLVLDEVIGLVSDATIEAMRHDRFAFVEDVAAGDTVRLASSGAAFYLRLVEESTNATLRHAINSLVLIVKLGSPHLENLIGLDTLSESQAILLGAVANGDVSEAKRALNMLTASPTTVRRAH